MSLLKLISNYAGYNHWANERMTGWLKTLDQSMFYKEALSSFASINLTLQHMINAQHHWLTIISRGKIAEPEKTIKEKTIDVVISDLLAGSQLMLNTFKAYTEEELLEEIYWNNMLQSRYQYIMHVVNHNSYHRGQIVTISRGNGVVNNIPETDYDTFLWYNQ